MFGRGKVSGSCKHFCWKKNGGQEVRRHTSTDRPITHSWVCLPFITFPFPHKCVLLLRVDADGKIVEDDIEF